MKEPGALRGLVFALLTGIIVSFKSNRRRMAGEQDGTGHCTARMFASLIGHLRSSTFRLSTTAVLMSLTGSRFSSESAPRPFHYGIRGRGGTIFGSALPLHQRQVQADIRRV